jgi:hypothetical protein
MPWSNNPEFGIKDAIARGHDLYEVIFNEWGFRDPGDPTGDYKNLQWPPTSVDTATPNGPTEVSVPTALAGIAIGPQSTVDRCWVSFNLGKSPTFATQASLRTNRLHRLSVDTPLMFTQNANPGKKDLPGAPDNPLFSQVVDGSLYVFPFADDFGSGNQSQFEFPKLQETTVLPQTYRPASGGAGVNFGTNVDGNNLFPRLHLYLYLKAPIVYAPQKRFPLQVQGTVGSHTPVAVGAERLIAAIPTFGRKRIHIMMMASQVADYRVGAIRAISQTTDLQEQPVDRAQAISPNTPVIVGPCAELEDVDYTNLYVTMSAPGTVLFQLTAYD